MTTPKAEALKAMLANELDPLARKIAAATLEHARENVEAIEDLKRHRRVKETPNG